MSKKIANASFFLVGALSCALAHGQATSETDTIAYSDNLSSWVLGQISQTTTNGAEVSRTSYDPSTALPTTNYRFGLLQQTLTYNADGTLATIKDGNGNTTTYKNYMRGIPQEVDFPATPDQSSGTEVTATVDPLGDITSITDAIGNRTCYGYDAMGRVNLIQYPSKTTLGQCGGSWLDTQITFSPNAQAQYGLPAGQWVQKRVTGNAETDTFYDGLWRPVVTQTYDTSNTNATISQLVTRYDLDSNVVFKSYPQRSTNTAITNTWGDPTQTPNALGTTSTYDVLDRVTSVVRSAESAIQDKTTISYLSGFQTQIADPNQNVTTIGYLTFDEPSTQWPILFAAPAGVTQTVSRDAFGNPTSITQSGTYKGTAVSLTKYFAYDSNHRLCRFYDPESNSTVYGYDNNSNVVWMATGQGISGDGTICGQNQVTASAQIVRTYDALNRMTAESAPTGTQSTINHYDADGHLTSDITGIIIQGFSYDSLGHLISEVQWLPNDNNYVRSIAYDYDVYGHLSKTTYPDGAIFGTFPDALGQATLVQGGNTLYASNISYYPDGGTAGYSLNNGITATIQRNTRQLPSNITYNQGGNQRFSEAYVYDADANLTAVTDLVNGKNSQTLGYDGLNRLTSDTAPNNWGTDSTTYDPLNNIRLHAITGLTLSFNYDSTNRLATITQGTPTGGGFGNFQYDARGNQTQSTEVFTVTPHTFDAKNQMLQIPGVATYSYDEAGRRIKKVLANGQVSYFFYSQAGQLMYAYNASTGQPTDYLYLNGKLIARYLAGQNPTYLLTDRLGTPVRETDPTGAVTQSLSYRPFGQLYSGPSQQQPGYTGHVFDPESSLSYMQARYQDGGLGQFLSVDPVGPTPGDVLNFNRYAYADNNPLTHTDPDGRDTVGENIDENAQAAANAGNNVATFGWAFAGAAWDLLGAESVSQVVDKGTGAGAGNMAMAAITVVTLGKGEGAANAVKGAAEVAGEATKTIEGMTWHAVNQSINRGVKPAEILDAVKNPLKKTAVKIDDLGRPSEKYIGSKASVAMNPETNKIVTVHPTSSKIAERLKNNDSGSP